MKKKISCLLEMYMMFIIELLRRYILMVLRLIIRMMEIVYKRSILPLMD